jgi:NAD(P)-dependent dehydrogenase (short-subunit alcohol dehydrogenase family)
MSFAIYPSLRDRRVIVTGGASGIGAEIVRAFAAQGASVGFLDRDVDAGAALVGDLDGAVTFEPCDLRDIDALRRALDSLRTPTLKAMRFGRSPSGEMSRWLSIWPHRLRDEHETGPYSAALDLPVVGRTICLRMGRMKKNLMPLHIENMVCGSCSTDHPSGRRCLPRMESKS